MNSPSPDTSPSYSWPPLSRVTRITWPRPSTVGFSLESTPWNGGAPGVGPLSLSLFLLLFLSNTFPLDLPGISVPAGLQLILFVPDKICETSEARALLPPSVSRADAIFNLGRTALLIHSFETGNLDDLRMATQDRLHQPARSSIIPSLFPLVEAAIHAGAHGAFLSGAGPTVMAITSGRKGDIYAQEGAERKEKEVAEAMKKVAKSMNERGRLYISRPTEYGASVVATDPPLEKYDIVSFDDTRSKDEEERAAKKPKTE